MNKNTIIIGSVLTILGIGGYMYWKSKKAQPSTTGSLPSTPGTTPGTTNGSISTGSTSNSGTTTVTPPATLQELTILQTDTQEQLKYLKAQGIQAKYTTGLGSDCPPKNNQWGQDFAYKNCMFLKQAVAVQQINKEINPLGYKLSKADAFSPIIKITV
jgi:hypothetical protein